MKNKTLKQSIMFTILSLSAAGINDFVIKIVTMLLNFAGEFLWWKFVVFRGSENLQMN